LNSVQMEAFKKLKYNIAAKTGRITKSVDEEYNHLKMQYELTKKTSANISNHLKSLVNHFHGFSTSLQLLAEDMRSMYDSDDPMFKIAENIEKTSNEIDQQYLQQFESDLQSKAIDLIEQFRVTLDEMKHPMKYREKIKRDYDFAAADVKKYTEKPPKDPSKLPRAKEKFNKIKGEYEQVTQEVKSKFEEIQARKPSYVDPAIKAMGLLTMNLLKNIATKAESSFSELESVKIERSPPQPKKKTPFYPTPEPVVPMSSEASRYEVVDWFYLDENTEQKGPINFTTLKNLYKEKVINDDTHVYEENMTEWKMIRDLPNVKALLS